MSSQADYWRGICARHLDVQGLTSMASDPWCRRVLGLAGHAEPVAASGWMWSFEDGSKLVASNSVVLVQPAATSRVAA